MKKNSSCLVIFTLAIGVANAWGYELATHGRLTEQAFIKSSLSKDPTLIDDLGLFNFNYINPFGENYYDLSGPALQERWANDFEKNNKLMSDPAKALTIQGWLMRGAIREDDAKGEKNPQDEPYNPDLRRPLHHFFDPYNNRPLDVIGLWLIDSEIHKAPDWAVGSVDAFYLPNIPEANRRNHFTVFDAREAMFRALTLETPANGGYAPLDDGSWNAARREQVRKTYWATTFRALGDVLHLNQDMAQPQHTRNEPHTGKGGWPAKDMLTGHTSVLEKYLDARVTGDSSYTLDGQPIIPAPLPYDSNPPYPIPAFSQYGDYWSSRPGNLQGVLTGKGLADYSNRGFFTPKYNYGNDTYPSPAPSSGTLETVTNPDGTVRKFLVVPVTDQYTGSEPDLIRMATRSAWDDFREMLGLPPTYTLTKTNYDAMADLLIPRAVAYSAGLINHFFRGRLKIELPDEGVYGLVDHSTIQIGDQQLSNFTGFGKIKLKLSNVTPNNEAMSGGKVIAVLKFRRNKCYKDDLTGHPPFSDEETCRTEQEEIVVSDTASNGATIALSATPLPIEFTFPKALPINATDVRLQVVYRGVLGQEADAVVVATQDLSEPTFFSYMNSMDYLHIGSKVYTRSEVNANKDGALSRVKPDDCVDYEQTPPQLKATCFNPINLPVKFSIGRGEFPATVNADLPAQRFFRIAFLGEAAGRTNIVHDEANLCYPHDDFAVDSLEWQDNLDAASNTITMTYPIMLTLRGTAGWWSTSCVWIADGSVPGSPDDRNQVMRDIGDKNPYPTQINGGIGF